MKKISDRVLGVPSGALYYNFGAEIGYQLAFTEQLKLDFQVGVGYGGISGWDFGGIYFKPAAGLGYSF